MTRNLKVFVASLVGSIMVWWGVNALSAGLEDFFYRQHFRGPAMLTAAATQQELEQKLQDARPLREKSAAVLELEAQSALAVYVKENGKTKVLFEKNSETPLPIASISKLMTALVAIENYPPNQFVAITPAILATSGQAGQLRSGDVLAVKDLLYLSLMESSNDAAVALAEPLSQEQFVLLMNQEAGRLGMRNTSFVNPTGLDEPLQSNASTAADLAKLARYLFERHPQVFDILSQRELALYAPDGIFHHVMRNTNVLLDYKDWPARMYGGKTGFTSQAKESLLLLVESPERKGYIITIILGSENRFAEMRQLLQWILQSYQWSIDT